MFNFYRYIFYQFYKHAVWNEKVFWKKELRTPAFIANISMGVFFLFFFLAVLIITPFDNDFIGLVPTSICLLIFFLNNELIIKRRLYIEDEQKFDNSSERNKRKTIFIMLLILTTSFIILSFVFGVGERNKKKYFSTLTIAKGMDITKALKVINAPDFASQSDNGIDSIYYYDFDYSIWKGAEIIFDPNSKKIKRISYLKK